MKEISKRKQQFNDFRFNGLNARQHSNKYLTMDRVNNDKTKIVVKVADSHLVKTKYGYALILDLSHVVFLKEWQVSCNCYGNEVILDKQYFNVKVWGNWENFFNDNNNCEFDAWLKIAQAQAALVDNDGCPANKVKWAI